MNLYQVLIGAELPDSEQTAALAAELRGGDAQATLAMLSGDRVLAPYGQAQQSRNMDMGRGLAQTRKSMEDRASQEKRHAESVASREKLAEAQIALSESHYAQMAGQHAASLSFQKAQQADTMSSRAADRALRTEMEVLKVGAGKAKEQAKQDKHNENERTRLGNKLTDEGIVNLEQSLKIADTEMEKYIDLSSGKFRPGVDDIPGYGKFDNWRPDWDPTLSNDALSLRRAMQEVANKLIKSEAGTAVSGTELERQARAMASGKGMSDVQFLEFYKSVKDFSANAKMGVMKSFTPEVQDLYMQGFEQPTTSGQTGSGVQYEVLP